MAEKEKSAQVGVSNTEVQQFYSCELAWAFGFHPELNYQKRDFGPARTRGIAGHKALEEYYQHLMEGSDHDTAAHIALQTVQDRRVQLLKAGDFIDAEMLDILNQVYNLLQAYFEYYSDEPEKYEILDVEGFYAMEWENEDDFYLPSRLDVVVVHKTGEFKGEVSPMDHKFTGDFWYPWKLNMNSQLPIQIRALRAARFSGIGKPVVRRAILNEIRTRSMKDKSPENLFKREFKPYPAIRIQKVFDNHMKTAVKIAWLKRIPVDEALEIVSASLGSPSCQFCDFRDVCDVMMDDRDPRTTIEATLEPNEYGYPPLNEIRNERPGPGQRS